MSAVFPVQADTVVSDLLNWYPQTAKVLLGLRTDCVGCPAARFCNLRNVAGAYNLALPTLLETLNAAIQPSLLPKEMQ